MKENDVNISFVLLAMKIIRLFKVFPITLQL